MAASLPLARHARAPLPAHRPTFALWQLGFRPFFLLASAFAALSIGLWALQFSGWISQPYLQGPLWHAHEMLFGFALAAIVGFLLTAGRNWSGQPTPTGLALMALALLWLAGRVLVLTPFGWAAALVNTAFPMAAAIALAVPFVAATNRRNYFFVGLLLLMAAAVSWVHLVHLGVLGQPAAPGIQVGLGVLLFIMAVMGGRVIPLFTNNSVPGAAARRHPALERAALGAILLLLAADLLQASGMLLATLAAAGASLHLARALLWQPWKTVRFPIVAILHAGYLWIPVHLALRASGEMGWLAPSAAVHALTVGAAGGLIIGMMTRVARGHTGRPVQADRSDVACYLLVAAAALVRVLVPLAWPAETVHAVSISAALWSAGFALYTVHYWPILTRARIDGKPG